MSQTRCQLARCAYMYETSPASESQALPVPAGETGVAGCLVAGQGSFSLEFRHDTHRRADHPGRSLHSSRDVRKPSCPRDGTHRAHLPQAA